MAQRIDSRTMRAEKSGIPFVLLFLVLPLACSKTSRHITEQPSAGGAAGENSSDSGQTQGSGAGTASGSGGDGGNGGSGGASASSSTGGSNSTGTGSGGGAGETGGPEPLEVLEISPVDGSSQVAREESIVVTFSEAVSADTVDPDSFRVTSGESALSGSLSVDGAEVTFTPDQPLPLLASITVTLTRDLETAGGGQLSEAFSADFVVRDGVFRSPERLSQDSAVNLDMAANARGDSIIVWQVGTPTSVKGVVFDAGSSSWGQVETLEDEEVLDQASPSASINREGDIVAVWRGPTNSSEPGGWNRYQKDVGWGMPRPLMVNVSPSVAVTDDGDAVVTWEVSGGAEISFSQLAFDSNQWTQASPLTTNARKWGLAARPNGCVQAYVDEDTNTYSASIFTEGAGWSLGRAIAPTDTDINWSSLTTRDDWVLVGFIESGTTAKANLYDGSTWWSSPAELGPGTFLSATSVAAPYALAGWANGDYEIQVRRYSAMDEWSEVSTVGVVSNEVYSFGAEVDPRGNALVAWPEDGSISWSRFGASQTWESQDPIQHEASSLRSAGSEDGSVLLVWQNNSGVWATRFE